MNTLDRTFEFKEKETVNKYYPQYYHKTDKVIIGVQFNSLRGTPNPNDRTADPSTSNVSAYSTSKNSTL